jgi:hypothetical protein
MDGFLLEQEVAHSRALRARCDYYVTRLKTELQTFSEAFSIRELPPVLNTWNPHVLYEDSSSSHPSQQHSSPQPFETEAAQKQEEEEEEGEEVINNNNIVNDNDNHHHLQEEDESTMDLETINSSRKNTAATLHEDAEYSVYIVQLAHHSHRLMKLILNHRPNHCSRRPTPPLRPLLSLTPQAPP